MIKHGSHSAYVHLKCRCELCRLAEQAYQQGYRAANGERLREYDRQPWRDTRLRDDPAKRKARGYAYDRLARGKVKEPCEVCGAPDTQLHHDDHGEPLVVRRLCVTCHGVAHRKQVSA